MAAALRTQLFDQQDHRGRVIVAALFASLVLHVAAFQNLSGAQRAVDRSTPIAVEIFHVAPPPQPQPLPQQEQAPAPPRPRQVTAKAKAAAFKPSPTPPPPVEEVKPVSNEPPPVVAGFRIESQTPASPIPGPVGNTPFGKIEAAGPFSRGAQPPWTKDYVPAGVADRDPVIEVDCKTEYPDEARRVEAQGTVRMRLTVDAAGKVVEVKPMPPRLGYGLDEAAHRAIWGCKFKPALKAGHPVATSLMYAYTFNLD
jgi:periplasmic protein TonB